MGLLAAAVLAVVRGPQVPMLDEETWLWLARNASFARPYDWWRPGPPWGDLPAPDAYVFAHPPLFLGWLQLLAPAARDLAEWRWLASLPFAALYGLSVGWLAERTPRPWPALALALSGPVVVLALGMGLMPDLMAGSLLTAALAAWLLGWRGEAPRRGWLVASGLALALASFTRYTSLILVPTILFDVLRRRGTRASWPFWLAFALPWLLGEGWLWALYGRPHLWEVLSRAGEIPRGPLGGRALGALARLGLALGPAALVGARGRVWIPAFLLGGLTMALGWPADLALGARLLLLTLAVLGALALLGARAGGGELGPVGVPLGLLVLLGVALGHNYAAPRYLLPGIAPLGLLLAARAPAWRAWLAAGVQLALALSISRAEITYAEAADAVASALAQGSSERGSFTGEWSFRWRMEQEGWTFAAAPPVAGTLVALPLQASPGFGAGPGWEAVAHASAGLGGLRVLDLGEGVGYDAETLGPLPLGWRPGRLEEGALWRVR